MKHKNAPQPASPQEAFRQLAYTFGVVELARQMGVSPGTLYNKADANDDTHHQPTLRDVVLATRLTGDMQVLDALNESFGRAAFDVKPLAGISDEALLELLLKLHKECGEFHHVMRLALLDKTFSTVRLRELRGEAFDMVGALMTLVNRMEGLLDE